MFEFTRSPYYNDILTCIKNVTEDNFSSPSVKELKSALKFMTGFIKQVKEIYEEQKLIQMADEIIKKENANIDLNLNILGEIITSMEDGINRKDKDLLLKEMLRGKEIIVSLFAGFDNISRIENSGPVYSDIPVLQEFIRITKGVIDGKFHVKPLEKMLHGFIEKVNNVYEEFAVMKKSQPREELDEEILKVEEFYKHLVEALNEMSRFFKDNDKSHLINGLEKVRYNSEQLVLSQKILETPKKENTKKSCFKCGTENPLSAKFCIKCRTPIPDFKSEYGEESSLDLTIEDDRLSSGRGPVMTENIYKLTMAVENYRAGKITAEQLSATVEWLEKKIESGRKQFENQKKKKPDNIPPEDKTLVAEMEELTSCGFSEFGEAMKDFKTFFKTGEEYLLEKALNKATEGGDKLYKVQAIFQAATKS